MEKNNSNPCNQDISIREKGKKLLEKLAEMGPDLSDVGKTSVRLLHGQSAEIENPKRQTLKSISEEKQCHRQDDTDLSISPSRMLRQMRASSGKKSFERKDRDSNARES